MSVVVDFIVAAMSVVVAAMTHAPLTVRWYSGRGVDSTVAVESSGVRHLRVVCEREGSFIKGYGLIFARAISPVTRHFQHDLHRDTTDLPPLINLEEPKSPN